MILHYLLLLSCIGQVWSNPFGQKQTVSASGQLLCPSDPKKATNVLVSLVDQDFLMWDDNMNSTRSLSDGTFSVQGSASEVSYIDPTLRIYHNCKNKHLCARYWKVKIPKDYINGGVFDAGMLNLEMEWPDEEHDCIHW